MRSALAPAEVCAYFAAWLLVAVCSLTYLYAVQEEMFSNNTITPSQLHDLKPGWNFLSRHRDESDIEWLTWKHYFHQAWLPLCIHFSVSEFLRNVKKSLVPYWYILFTINFMMITFGFREMLLIFSQPILYILFLYTGAKKIMIWTVSIALLVAVNSESIRYMIMELINQNTLQDEKAILIWLSMGWIELRCMSFSFDYIDYFSSSKMKNDKNEVSPRPLVSGLLSYSLYFPTLLMGPVILYSEFQRSLVGTQCLSARLTKFLKEITIFMIYTYLKELTMHFIYFLAMQNDLRYLQYIRMLPSLALCGAGLWMGMQFYIKYVIMYGTAGAFASLDHIEPPPVPRCIARIHLYSQMWKYFDVGLYRFLREYIYKPALALMTADRNATMVKKVSASFITFSFIYLWHGTMLPVLIWSVLNYLGVLIEHTGPIIQKTKLYAKFKRSILRTNQMEERFKAFISTPLLIMSALSNFYLFTDYLVGNIFVERFLSESWTSIAFIYLSMYTCCHVSSILTDVPSRTARKS